MRRIRGTGAGASAHGCGRLHTHALRRTAALFAFAVVCYLVAPWLGLDSFTVDPRIAEVWPPGGVGFVLLTTVWFAGTRVLGATLALMVAVFFVTAAVAVARPRVAAVVGAGRGPPAPADGRGSTDGD